MQQMLEVCEDSAMRFNNITLGGSELPLVSTAVHVGLELHESGKMDFDAKVKRAEFIDKSVGIREAFGFASPVEILTAHKLYCSSFYGSMLWNLSGEGASQVFNAWNTAVKLSWDCPRDTRTYLLQQVLSCGLDSARTDILVRFTKFLKSLRNSPSMEVRALVNLVSRDIKTTTGSNIRLVEEASGLSAWDTTKEKMREAIGKKELVDVDDQDRWRIPYLNKLLGQRQEMSYKGLDQELEKSRMDDLINSLCIH